MTESLTGTERYVSDRLGEIGIATQKLSEKIGRRTCDLLGNDETASYLIEVKTRTSDERIRKALRKEGVTDLFSQPMGFSVPTYKLLRHAVRQLDATEVTGAPFKLIWVHVDAKYNDEVTLLAQVHDTVFGVGNLVKLTPENMGQQIACYFFSDSLFFRHRQIDAVIIEAGYACGMLLNVFANRLEEFRTSHLFASFNVEPNRVIDPVRLEVEQRAFLADCDLPRSDEAAVLAYVRSKYNLPRWGVFNIPMKHHSAFVSMPLGNP